MIWLKSEACQILKAYTERAFHPYPQHSSPVSFLPLLQAPVLIPAAHSGPRWLRRARQQPRPPTVSPTASDRARNQQIISFLLCVPQLIASDNIARQEMNWEELDGLSSLLAKCGQLDRQVDSP